MTNIGLQDSSIQETRNTYESDEDHWLVPRPESLQSLSSSSDIEYASSQASDLDFDYQVSQHQYILPFPSISTTSAPPLFSAGMNLYPTLQPQPGPVQPLNVPQPTMAPPAAAPQVAQPAHHLPPLYSMPLRDSKQAPKTFKGKYSEVARFIKHYVRLLDQHRVITEADKCEGVLEYCSRKVRDFIEASPHYLNPNWNQLQTEILKYYDAERQESKFHTSDFMAFLRNSHNTKLRNLAQWKRYYREYVTRGGFLLNKSFISDSEYHGYFWKGIPQNLQKIFEEKLYARHPLFDTTAPWPIDHVTAIADRHFNRGKYTERLLPILTLEDDSQMEFSNSESDDSSSSESESDSDKDNRKKRRKHRLKTKSKERKGRYQSTTTQHMEEDRTRVISAPPEEIEGIIQKLNTMSIEDPTYAPLYYKAVRSDSTGIVGQCIRRQPKQERVPYPSPSSYAVTRDIVNIQPPAPSYRPPTTYPNNIPLNTTAPPGGGTPASMRPENDYRCFGCFDQDHMLGECPKMGELLRQGVVQYDEPSRKFYMNGRKLFRRNSESLVQTVERLRQFRPITGMMPQVQLVTLAAEVSNYMENHHISEEEDTDDYDDGPYWRFANLENSDTELHSAYHTTAVESDSSEEDYPEVYPVERTSKKSTQARKEISRSPIKNVGKEKPASKVPPPRAGLRTRSFGPIRNQEPDPPTPPLRKERHMVKDSPVAEPPTPTEAVFEPTPFDSRKVRFHDDIEMGEAENRSKAKAPMTPQPTLADVPVKQRDNSKEVTDKVRTGPRQSEVSSQVDTRAIVQDILDTQISLKLREVLGTSKELSTTFQEVIKLKNMFKPSSPPNTTAQIQQVLNSSIEPNVREEIIRNDELLIKLPLTCNGRPITAVIDTGSQLNVISESLAWRIIRLPVDLTKGIYMNDANGGEGYLKGLIEKVPLSCGGVETQSNIYVGEQVPFDLLLGRPWQRGNFVTIDERPSGTYLIFKDRKSHKPKFEYLVTSESLTPRTFQPVRQVGVITVAKIGGEEPTTFDIEDLLEFEKFLQEGRSDSDKLTVQTYATKWYTDRTDPWSKFSTKAEVAELERRFEQAKLSEQTDGPSRILEAPEGTYTSDGNSDAIISGTDIGPTEVHKDSTPNGGNDESSLDTSALHIAPSDTEPVTPEEVDNREAELNYLALLLWREQLDSKLGKLAATADPAEKSTTDNSRNIHDLKIDIPAGGNTPESPNNITPALPSIFLSMAQPEPNPIDDIRIFPRALGAFDHALHVLEGAAEYPERCNPCNLKSNLTLLAGVGVEQISGHGFAEFAVLDGRMEVGDPLNEPRVLTGRFYIQHIFEQHTNSLSAVMYDFNCPDPRDIYNDAGTPPNDGHRTATDADLDFTESTSDESDHADSTATSDQSHPATTSEATQAVLHPFPFIFDTLLRTDANTEDSSAPSRRQDAAVGDDAATRAPPAHTSSVTAERSSLDEDHTKTTIADHTSSQPIVPESEAVHYSPFPPQNDPLHTSPSSIVTPTGVLPHPATFLDPQTHILDPGHGQGIPPRRIAPLTTVLSILAEAELAQQRDPDPQELATILRTHFASAGDANEPFISVELEIPKPDSPIVATSDLFTIDAVVIIAGDNMESDDTWSPPRNDEPEHSVDRALDSSSPTLASRDSTPASRFDSPSMQDISMELASDGEVEEDVARLSNGMVHSPSPSIGSPYSQQPHHPLERIGRLHRLRRRPAEAEAAVDSLPSPPPIYAPPTLEQIRAWQADDEARRGRHAPLPRPSTPFPGRGMTDADAMPVELTTFTHSVRPVEIEAISDIPSNAATIATQSDSSPRPRPPLVVLTMTHSPQPTLIPYKPALPTRRGASPARTTLPFHESPTLSVEYDTPPGLWPNDTMYPVSTTTVDAAEELGIKLEDGEIPEKPLPLTNIMKAVAELSVRFPQILTPTIVFGYGEGDPREMPPHFIQHGRIPHTVYLTITPGFDPTKVFVHGGVAPYNKRVVAFPDFSKPHVLSLSPAQLALYDDIIAFAQGHRAFPHGLLIEDELSIEQAPTYYDRFLDPSIAPIFRLPAVEEVLAFVAAFFSTALHDMIPDLPSPRYVDHTFLLSPMVTDCSSTASSPATTDSWVIMSSSPSETLASTAGSPYKISVEDLTKEPMRATIPPPLLSPLHLQEISTPASLPGLEALSDGDDNMNSPEVPPGLVRPDSVPPYNGTSPPYRPTTPLPRPISSPTISVSLPPSSPPPPPPPFDSKTFEVPMSETSTLDNEEEEGNLEQHDDSYVPPQSPTLDNPTYHGILAYGHVPQAPGRSRIVRVYLHPTLHHDFHDCFAYGGKTRAAGNEPVSFHPLPNTPYADDATKRLGRLRERFIEHIEAYLNSEEGYEDGVAVPDSLLTNGTKLGYDANGLPKFRFAQVEELIATIVLFLRHPRLNQITHDYDINNIRYLVSPGYALSTQTEFDLASLSPPRLPHIHRFYREDEPHDERDVGPMFDSFGAIGDRLRAFRLDIFWRTFDSTLFYATAATNELLAMQNPEAGNATIPEAPLDWVDIMQPYDFKDCFPGYTHADVVKIVQTQPDQRNAWLPHLHYLVLCRRQITQLCCLIEKLFRSIGFTGIKEVIDASGLNTYLDYNHSPILETEEAVLLTAAYDFMLREHRFHIAREILLVLHSPFRDIYDLIVVLNRILTYIEPPTIFKVYDEEDDEGKN